MAEFDLVVRGGRLYDGRGSDPVAGDVAVKDGVIVSVGKIPGTGAEEIDARGLAVTPGFVDVHTHYDGQITWENTFSPSSNHGVTTVVMGNCGVGFAPARPGDHELVIRLMEGVEDIPGVVMATGVPWNWETFEDYLDALDKRQGDIDFAAQIPHSPLRVYVMGDRALSDGQASPEELAKMRELVARAVRAGALGVTTSHNLFHRFRSGEFAPSLRAEQDEMLALAAGLKDAGAGVFQIIPRLDVDAEGELSLIEEIVRTSRRPVNFSLLGAWIGGNNWSKYLVTTDALNAQGFDVRAHFLPRPVGIMFGLDLSFHEFCLNPSYRPIADLPLAEKVARMRDPELRAKLLAEQPEDPNPAFVELVSKEGPLFALPDPVHYRFRPEDSLSAKASREGRPVREVIYDALLEDDGRAILCRYTADVVEHQEQVTPLIGRENMIVALGDGGAHYGMVCDAAYTTYLLSEEMGERGLNMQTAIKALTSQPARSVGLEDRGVIAPGYKADLNVIDVDRLKLYRPAVTRDLPAGGRRLSQRAGGYVATIVSGKITYRNGQATGALPGRLVRGARKMPGYNLQAGG